jgi:hypothetical protein
MCLYRYKIRRLYKQRFCEPASVSYRHSAVLLEMQYKHLLHKGPAECRSVVVVLAWRGRTRLLHAFLLAFLAVGDLDHAAH